MRSSGAWSLLFVVCAGTVFAACDTPGVTLVNPDVSAPDVMTTIHVKLEDSVLADALGWSQGVPNAEVQLQRMIDLPFSPDTFYTDSTGRVQVPDPFPGFHDIAAFRALADHETGPTSGLVRAFADGLKPRLPASKVTLTLGMDRPGSTVIMMASI